MIQWESRSKCCYGNLTLADDGPERAELQFSAVWDRNRDCRVFSSPLHDDMTASLPHLG
jgi:hypothetical protein